ncbi:YfiR family protein [Catenovulum adriaticum]|uniref:YfiR family protein n=1 Tax=Catenovulum adriaticum TaxID=2984846 RepID=A0ABY7ANA0_9ALTE|nr:YfiR family protein [Catenovulum sp. TS8]WAJ70785.1 YfiR family protein [Catenovulum sp. TS8]
MKQKRLVAKLSLIFVLLNFICASSAYALINQPDEESLRAAMVIGILRFTKLPLEADVTKIQVCTVGQPLVEKKLGSVISSLRVAQKKLTLTKIDSYKQNTDFCHVIIEGENALATEQTFKKLSQHKRKPLIVCDGCEHGLNYSAIEIFKRNSGIGFKVNLVLAKQNNIVFSSSLLELATEIKGN